jgi:hypothetical protein
VYVLVHVLVHVLVLASSGLASLGLGLGLGLASLGLGLGLDAGYPRHELADSRARHRLAPDT